jgi:hypothetical protein
MKKDYTFQKAKFLLHFLIAAWCMALFEGRLHAAEYYVRVDGSDTNNGTTNTSSGAWRTLNRSITAAQAGDTVYIGEGTWEEKITTVRHGTTGKPIVWSGVGSKTLFGGFAAEHDYIHLKNVHIGPVGTWAGSTTFGSSKNMNKTNPVGNYGLMENVLFTRTTGQQSGCGPNRPLYTGPVGIVWRNCRFIGGGGNGGALYVQGVDCVVEGCTFTSSNGGDAVILMGRRNILRNNAWDKWIRPPGSSQHSDCLQSFSSNGETSIDHVIENNIFTDCHNTQWGHIEDQARQGNVGGWTFRNNFVIRVGAPMTIYTRDMQFYNNTFYKTSEQQSMAILYRTSTDRGKAARGRVFNNIFYKGGSNPQSTGHGFYAFVENTGGGPLEDFQADNNLVIGEGAGTTKGGVWAKYGANVNSLNGVDPMFINIGEPTRAEDLRVKPDSPVIGRGRDLSALFTGDFNGASRGGRWDIGAWQSGDSGTGGGQIRLQAPVDFRVNK